MATFTADVQGADMFGLFQWSIVPIDTIAAVAGANGTATVVDVTGTTVPLVVRYTGSLMGWVSTTPTQGSFSEMEYFFGGQSGGVLQGFTVNFSDIQAGLASSPNLYSPLDGDDTLNGSAFADILTGGYGGNDIFNGGGGGDEFVISNADTVQAAHQFNGDAAALDTVTVAQNVQMTENLADMRASTFASIERLSVAPNLTVFINSSQIGSGQLATNLNFLGFAGNATLHVQKDILGTLNCSAFTITGGAVVVDGTDSGDVIIGTSASDTLTGFAGIDNLSGGLGADILNGGSDADTLNGGGGNDDLTGGIGNDTYYIDTLLDVVHEAAGAANGTQDTVISTVNVRLDTTTTAQGVEHVVLQGSSGATVVGSSVFNIVTGNTGANYLAGYGGNDTVSGGIGSDTVFGGDGKDTLTGGTGDDKFLYSFIADSGGTQPRRDVIADFSQIAGNNDWIDLALTDANGALANNQAFTWRGTAAFTGAAGELRYFQDGPNNRTVIEGNVRVDAASPGAEFSIELTGLYFLTAGATNAFDIIL